MITDHSLLPVYRYEVEIDRLRIFGFKTISGLKLSAAYEPLEVGGVNNGPVMLRMPVKDTGRITFERGKYLSEFWSPFMFRPGLNLGRQIIILVKDDHGIVGAVYRVQRPMLEAIELSTLDAMDSSVFVEKFTIVHEGISEI